ncbi:MAG: SAM-dependent chlorinase/fluorinase [Alphaproteobacteria bacterium]|nr:SAM-dependent chlorinase/fluorinase [Alphaproteobacteria bacterium]
MIALFTDFGLAGPYTGQMKAVLHLAAPEIRVIDLFADAPSRNPKVAAYLLAAYAQWFPPGTVFLSVVDPGVGGARAPVIVAADDRWFVGPDNGLFEIVKRRAVTPAREWEITWRPASLSASFHGRDLFAPVAARLTRGDIPGALRDPATAERRDWPDDLAEIVYVDHYGNAMTGLRANLLPKDAGLEAGNKILPSARTFSAVPEGAAFWYENSTGLAEIAVNGGRADTVLGLAVGSKVRPVTP